MTLKKLYILLIVSISLLNMKLYAAPIADNTMGTVVSPLPQKLPDGRLESTISGGLLKPGKSLGDGNLFHSFLDFNIGQHEVVTFDSSIKVTNILARVTGNIISSIDGELKANANLYLLNPSGFIFKEHTKLDIQGSFYASTADGVNLEDGGKFLARDGDPRESLLTSAPPSAFGFLDSPRGASIDIQAGNQVGTVDIKNSTFYAPNGLINVTKSNGELQIADSTFFAPRGQINITANDGLQISHQSPWLLPLPPEDPSWKNNPLSNFLRKFDVNEDGRFGEVPVLVPVGTVDVSGWGGGKISISAGQFVLDKAVILADNYGGEGDFSTIDITVGGKMQLLNGAKITTDNYANGHGGNLGIIAGNLQLSGLNPEMINIDPTCLACLSTIATNNSGSGGIGGNITINTSTLEITPGLIQSATQTDGAAGNITIEADKVILKEQGYIAANTQGQGQGGTINITAKDMISLDNSNITAKTDSIGKAGDISIKTEKLNLANKGIISSLSNMEENNAGDAGSIDIEAGIVNISTDGKVPISETAWNDVSGIAVIAKEARGGNINMEVRDSLSLVHSKITARSTGPNSSDNGGNIWIKGLLFSKLRELKLVDKGYILASADAGNGGDIEIWAENAFLSDNSSISAKAIQATGGNITLNMRDGLYLNNSKITAESRGNKESDNGGNLTISNLKVLDLEKSALFTSAKRGYGGNITVPENTIGLGKIEIIERSTFAGPELDLDALEVERDKVVKDLIERRGYSVIDSTSLVEGKDGILRLPPLQWEFKEFQALPPEPPKPPPLRGRCSLSKDRFTITARDILPRCPEDLRTQTIRLGNYY